MDARDQLEEAFERGFETNGEALQDDARDLYLIQSFLIEHEQGGWLYNWSTTLERFDVTIPAMQRRGLQPLAEVLLRIREILAPVAGMSDEMETAGRQINWREILAIIDPKDELKGLESRISALPDYGLPKHW